MANYTITVGLSGRSFTTIQAALNSLPASIPATDNYTITVAAGLYTGGLTATGKSIANGSIVVIKPETGASWWELYPGLNHPLAYDNTVGVVIEGNTAGGQPQFITLDPFVRIEGLQIKVTAVQPVLSVNSGAQFNMSKCLVVVPDSQFIIQTANAFGGDFYNNTFFVTSTTKAPFSYSDHRNSNYAGNTIYAQNGNSAAWLTATANNGTALCKDNVIIGFGSAPSTYMNSSSSNNATDLSTLFGTSNLVSQTAAGVFKSATSGSLDLRPKTGSPLIGAGVTSSFIPVDTYNVTRPASPTIGSSEPATVPTPAATISYTEANDTSAITTNVAVTGVGATISYTEANDTSAITGSVTTPTGTITTGAFKNNTGTVLASLTALTVTVLNLSTMAFVKTFTGVTTNTSGIMTLTDTSLVTGTQYAVVTSNASGTLGVEKYTAA